jgi:DNA (cytosine-5)-methyltransferase 1
MLEYTFVDLFSGAGGMSLGFQAVGFKCVAAIDHDEFAFATYSLNFGHHISRSEITEETTIPQPLVIIGGPPCQGFSSAGLRRADDQRNSLVRVFAEIIASARPKAFVFENVEGFLTADDGKRVFDLLDVLIAAGYRIHLRKLNAANYGIPQHRKRVIAIGGLGWDPSFPEATHMAYGAPGTTRTHTHLPKCPTLLDALASLPTPALEPPGTPQGHYAREMSSIDIERIHRLLPGQTMRDLPKELWHNSYARRANRRVADGTPTENRGGAPAGVRRLQGLEPSKAITSGAVTEFVHPVEDRYLTLRECARIQTFPDTFVFSGDGPSCALQIGNAVPPKLAEVIGKSLIADFESSHSKTLNSRGALLSFVPTFADGMSPVLQRVVTSVKQKYLKSSDKEMEQWGLWG